MALPEGLQLVEEKSDLPGGLVLVEDKVQEAKNEVDNRVSLEQQFRETKASQAVASKDFSAMPDRSGKPAEYSSDPELENMLQKRKWEVKQSRDEYAKGNIGFAEKEFQILSKGGFGATADFIGKEIVDSVKGLWQLGTTESFRKSAEAAAHMTWEAAKDSDIAKNLMEWGGEVGDWWDDLDKNTRKNLESLGLVGMFMSPAKIRAGAKPIIDTTKQSKLAKKLVSGVESNAKTIRKKYADSFVLPKETAAVQKEQILRQTKAGGRVVPDRVHLTKAQEEMAEAVSRVPNLSANNHLMRNIWLVNQKLDANEKALQAIIKAKSSNINKLSIDKSIANAASKTMEGNPHFIGDTGKGAMKRVFAAREIVNKYTKNGKISSGNLLKARRDFDDLINAQDGAKAFSRDKPIGQLNHAIRESMNEMVDKSVGGGVKQNLRDSHLLIKANQNAATKQVGIAKGAITRQLQHVGQVLKVKQMMVAGSLLAGVSVLAGAKALLPILAGTAGVVGVGAVGRAVYLSQSARRGVVELIKATDKALKVSTNTAMRMELKEGRAALTSLLLYADKAEDLEKQQEQEND